jgi:uncharacterized protein YbbK (DUF523 family)/uncharacterized protein YbgA (DUF1722 family)
MNCNSFKGARPRIGISACLNGAAVRFNGGHVRADWITDVLSRFVDLVPVCPEVEMGLSVPREPIRLVRDEKGSGPKLVTSKTAIELTDLGNKTVARLIDSLPQDLTAFVLTGRSPMCGKERVKIYAGDGQLSGYGPGLFAAELQKKRPELIICEAGRLADPVQRERFALQIFVQAAAREIPPDLAKMQEFHRRYKFLISSQGAHHLRLLGALLGRCTKSNVIATLEDYRRLLRICFSGMPQRNATVDALTHMYGFLKKELSSAEKTAILSAIERYRLNKVSLTVPLYLLHFANQTVRSSFVAEQVIFAPYPELEFAVGF